MPTTLARILTVLGAAGLIGSAWLVWLEDTTATDLPWRRLYGAEMEATTDEFLLSVALLLVVAAAAALLGAALPARAPAFVGGLVAAGVTVLLLVQEQLDRENGLTVADVGPGAWCALAASAVVILGSTGLHHDVQRDVVRA